MKCSTCKKPINRTYEFCPFCGAKQNRKKRIIIAISIVVGSVISAALLLAVASWLLDDARDFLSADREIIQQGLEDNTQEAVSDNSIQQEDKILEYEVAIHIESTSDEVDVEIKAQIYNNATGAVKDCTLKQGDNYISLPEGSYILLIEDEQYELFEKSFEVKEGQNGISAELLAVQTSASTEIVVADAIYEVFTNNGYTYEYAIPKIESEIGDIPAINQEIYDEFYTNLVKKDLTNPNLAYPTVGEVSYKWYVSESVLSLVIKATLNDFGVSYDTYCIDLNDGRRITNEELLAMRSMDLRTYSELLKSNLQTAYIDMYRSRVEKGWMSEEEYKAGLEATMLDENIERSQLLLNPNGELCATGIVFNETFVFVYFMNMETWQLEEYEEWP